MPWGKQPRQRTQVSNNLHVAADNETIGFQVCLLTIPCAVLPGRGRQQTSLRPYSFLEPRTVQRQRFYS